MQTEKVRACKYCDKPVKGRTDKKFCNDFCRNQYNNNQNAPTNNLVRNINHALLRNRRILENCIAAEENFARAHREKLLQKGFLFRYATHKLVNRAGSIFLFCYDYGYLPLENDWYLIVRSASEMETYN